MEEQQAPGPGSRLLFLLAQITQGRNTSLCVSYWCHTVVGLVPVLGKAPAVSSLEQKFVSVAVCFFWEAFVIVLTKAKTRT